MPISEWEMRGQLRTRLDAMSHLPDSQCETDMIQQSSSRLSKARCWAGCGCLLILLLLLPEAAQARLDGPLSLVAQAASELPSGWNRCTSKDGRLRIALPGEWLVASTSDPKFLEALQKLAKAQPNAPLPDLDKFYFLAVSSEPVDGFSDNLNVVKQRLQAPVAINEAWGKEVETMLASRFPGTTEIQTQIVPLLGRTALRYQAVLVTTRANGQNHQNFIIGYMVFVGNDQYVLTFTTRPAARQGFVQLVDQAIKHLEVLSEEKESAQSDFFRAGAGGSR